MHPAAHTFQYPKVTPVAAPQASVSAQPQQPAPKPKQ
jgi:hypothetical protein